MLCIYPSLTVDQFFFLLCVVILYYKSWNGIVKWILLLESRIPKLIKKEARLGSSLDREGSGSGSSYWIFIHAMISTILRDV
jgi:hypothetical protein